MKIKVSYKQNVISYLLFLISSPLVKIFAALMIKPNAVTAFGFVISLIAVLLLYFNIYLNVALFLWLLSIVLDHCDGALARFTNTVRKHKFRFDHFSDLLKVAFIFAAIAASNNNLEVQLCAIYNVVMFMFREVLVINLNQALKQKSVSNPSANGLKQNSFVQNSKNIILTINGHSPLLLCFCFSNSNYLMYIIFYFSLIITKDLILFSHKLLKIQDRS